MKCMRYLILIIALFSIEVVSAQDTTSRKNMDSILSTLKPGVDHPIKKTDIKEFSNGNWSGYIIGLSDVFNSGKASSLIPFDFQITRKDTLMSGKITLNIAGISTHVNINDFISGKIDLLGNVKFEINLGYGQILKFYGVWISHTVSWQYMIGYVLDEDIMTRYSGTWMLKLRE